MGLDIYFFKYKKADKADLERLKKEGNKLHGKYLYECRTELDLITDEIGILEEEAMYFRKIYFLLDFFNYKENCSDLPINKEQTEKLLDLCNKTLDDNDPYVLNTDYESDRIKEVRDKFTNFMNNMDWDNEEVYMYCWW